METVRLEIVGLRKEFGPAAQRVTALEDVSLSLGAGRVVGVFGNNGAGKTTLARVVAGLVEPDVGAVRIDGVEQGGARNRLAHRVGLAGADERSFYPRLGGRENLRLFGGLHGLPPVECDRRSRLWAERLGLAQVLERPFQSWSSGQRQRLNLIRAFLHEPDVVVLDEATRSTDPATVELVRAVLAEEARERGRLVLYTGHEFHGIEELCDEIVVLDHGRVVLAGPGKDVLAGLAAPAWRVRFATGAGRDRALAALAELEPGEDERVANWPIAGRAGLPPGLARWIDGTGAEVVSLERRVGLGVRELLLRLARGEALVARAPEAPPARAARPPEPGALPPTPSVASILRALARRDRAIHLSYRFKLALQSLLVLVWGTIFAYLARMLDTSDPTLAAALHGDPLAFLLFGLAALRISQTCLLHMGHALREEQLTGTVEPLVATGVPPSWLVLGSLVWPLAINLATMGLMVAFGAWVLGAGLPRANWPAVAVATAVGCSALSGLGLLSAAFVLAFKRGDPVAMFLNMTSLVLAGAYFPRELLPGFLRRAALLIPHTHALDAVRAAAIDGAGFADPGYRSALVSLIVASLVLLPAAALVWRAALRHARRGGTLGHA
jgi:ABC-type multidrug transport system ATPase subunit/ABC-type multidrug transport system permease subunit